MRAVPLVLTVLFTACPDDPGGTTDASATSSATSSTSGAPTDIGTTQSVMTDMTTTSTTSAPMTTGETTSGPPTTGELSTTGESATTTSPATSGTSESDSGASGCPDLECGHVEVLQVAVHANFICALLDDGKIRCWGSGMYFGAQNALGDMPCEMGPNLPAIDLGPGSSSVSLTIGSASCAVLTGGGLKCWGENDHGQLGLGDIEFRGDQPGEMGDNLPMVSLGAGKEVALVEAGGGHACAVLTDGQLKCWGSNVYGQLGLEDTEDRGDEPGEMGDALPTVDLGTGRTAMAVTVGPDFTCALLDGGEVKCWGVSSRLGLGINGVGPGGEPGDMGDALPVVELGAGATAIQIQSGYMHTCALLADGRVKCWGAGDQGALGIPTSGVLGDAPGEMGDALPAVDLGDVDTATDLHCAGSHSCVVLTGGSVKCWGWNYLGQLGLGDEENRGDNGNEMGEALPAVDLVAPAVRLAQGYSGAFNCAILSGGELKCWGHNDLGQLGLGDEENRGDEPGEMGENLPRVELCADG